MNFTLCNTKCAYLSILLCAVTKISGFYYGNLIQNFYSYSNANQRLGNLFLTILRCGDRSALQTNDTWNQHHRECNIHRFSSLF